MQGLQLTLHWSAFMPQPAPYSALSHASAVPGWQADPQVPHQLGLL